MDDGGPGGFGRVFGSHSELMLQQRDFDVGGSSSGTKHCYKDVKCKVLLGSRQATKLTLLINNSFPSRLKCAFKSQYMNGFQKLLLIAVHVTIKSKNGGT